MFDDELEPQKQAKTPKNLEPMSLDELNNYIQTLRDEIVRAEQEIARKRAHMDAASSIFK